MILSVSKKTDIPALYSDWFLNRLKEGYLLVADERNPFNLSKINLSKEVVDLIIFWTKNPLPLIDKLSVIEKMGYNYSFQFTITPYTKKIEPNIPSKNKIIESFIALSKKIGKQKVIWRYDPIILTSEFNLTYHKSMFDHLCEKLSPYTTTCVITFFDRNIFKNKTKTPLEKETIELVAKELSVIAKKYGIFLVTSQKKYDLSKFNIPYITFTNKKYLEKILNTELITKFDKVTKQEKEDISYIDVGSFNTCINSCSYCYANYSPSMIRFNNSRHNKTSPLLIGSPSNNNKITIKKAKSFKKKQLSIFDI